MTPSSIASRRGLLVVTAAVSINLILGALYAWGVIAKALVMQWGWTKTQASLPFTISTALFAVMMIFAGRAQDRIGPRVVAMVGGVIFGLGLFASAYAHSPLLMAITFGGIGGAGLGLGYSATTPPAIKWYPASKKGLVTGIVVSGVGLSAVYVSPLTQLLLEKTSILTTFMFLGLGAVVLIMFFSQFLSNPPADFVPVQTAAASSSPTALAKRSLDWHEMLRTRAFYMLWIMFVLAASAGLMIIAHVAIIAKEQAGWKWGFVPVAMLAIFNTLGRVVSGIVSDRMGRTRTMVLAFVLQAINMFLFSHYTSPSLLVFGSAFTGLCYGTIYTLMPAATADFYGVKHLGVNYGFVFSGFGVAGILGPILGGRIRDLSGSYSLSYTISACMLVVAAAMALATRAPTSEEAA